VEEHEATGHVSHRSWCRHCERARKAENPHYQAPEEPEHAIPTVGIDYCFAGMEDRECIPIFVGKCRKSKRIWATVVKAKGAEPFSVAWTGDLVKESGHKKMFFKSDDEG